ncbi:MAG TPA: DUF4446 family protein [Thermoleophilia bacterium]|nr:DUF4446 family protein [Thermoleophilia bacterium]
MQTLRDIAPYVALGAAVLAAVLLVLVLVLWSTVRRLRRSQSIVLGHHEERDVVAHVVDLDAQVRNLREAVEILTDQLDEHKRHLDRALTNRAIVRYDAFRDAGGEQSASFALLDNHRSGVVFSAIAARDFARIYVKHLSNGVADRDLSPEEQQVVALAVPRPLAAGEDGPRSARVPVPADPARPRPGELAGSATASGGEPAAAAPRDEAARAFEALADIADAPAAERPVEEDFSWETGARRPGGAQRPAAPDDRDAPAAGDADTPSGGDQQPLP